MVGLCILFLMFICILIGGINIIFFGFKMILLLLLFFINRLYKLRVVIVFFVCFSCIFWRELIFDILLFMNNVWVIEVNEGIV